MYSSLAGGPIGVSLGFEDVVEQAAHVGFGGVALNTGYAAENGPEAVVQMLEERGLKPGGWGLPVRMLGTDEEFEAALDKLGPVAEVASRCGDLRTSTWILSFSEENPFAQQFELLHGRTVRVAAVLDEFDVRLGLEFIGPATLRAGKKHEFIYDMDGMLELTRSIPTANVGLLLDCWHLYTSGGQMDDVLGLSDSDVVQVHINDAPAGVALDAQVDNVRGLPGETGVIDCKRFLECLVQIGYTGPITAEPFSARVKEMDDQDAIAATKQAIDSVWPDGE